MVLQGLIDPFYQNNPRLIEREDQQRIIKYGIF